MQVIGTSVNGQRSSGLFTQTEGKGEAGDMTISTPVLLVQDGAKVSGSTRGEGNAANLIINASNLIEIDGLNSSLFSSTGGTGNAGTVNITTSELKVQNNAQIGVNNFVETELKIEPLTNSIVYVFNPVEGSGNAGKLSIAAESIQLEDGGSLVAISAGGDGGDINLNSDLLIFRGGGNISTTAGLQDTPGSGGNINIDQYSDKFFSESIAT